MYNSAENSPVRSSVERSSPTTSDVLRVLGDERRRRTLSTLTDAPLPVPVSRVAHAVAIEEHPGDGDVPPERVEEVHVTLRHVHLPKLASAGLVSYDAEAGTVEDVVEETGIPLLDV